MGLSNRENFPPSGGKINLSLPNVDLLHASDVAGDEYNTPAPENISYPAS